MGKGQMIFRMFLFSLCPHVFLDHQRVICCRFVRSVLWGEIARVSGVESRGQVRKPKSPLTSSSHETDMVS